MRAVVLDEIGPPEKLEVRADIAVPQPGPSDVQVRVRACGVDAHDTAVRGGLIKNEFRAGMILGHEIAGDVVSVGAAVRSVEPGDRVCCKQTTSCGLCALCRTAQENLCPRVSFNTGGLAEYVALPQDAWVQIPEGVGYESAAILSCAVGTVYHAVTKIAKLRVGERALITGAGGGLGLHAIQVCKYLGAEVFAVTTSPGKRDAIAMAGADHVLALEDSEPLYSRTGALTYGKGIDVVIDTVGTPAFAPALRTLGLFGRYVVVGQLYPEKVAFYPAHLFGKEQRILGANGTRRHELEELLALVAAGRITPFVAKVLGLSGAVAAHRAIESGQATGRIVIDPTT